uniref:F-box domain-containing protein n=1 Tax=Strongyloides stercoralis TaxID=6248 RepID=A0A0K0DU44_STRER
MLNYEDMLKAFHNKRILKKILSNLMDQDIMNLNYTSKGINNAIKQLKHREKVPSDALYITLDIKNGCYKYESIPKKFNSKKVSKITFDFLLYGMPVQYENLNNEYNLALNRISSDFNMLLLQCTNDLYIKIQSYYHFFEKFLISFINSINCYNNVKLDINIKPYGEDFNIEYSTFNFPTFNMFEGFKNIESINIRNNFNEGTEFFKYFFQCLPDNYSLKVNIDFVEYLNKKQWSNVESIINFQKSTKFKIGLKCWGEDGSFWHYIPNAISQNFLKRIYFFEVNGDSFNILKKFKSLFKQMENLKILVCNFHVYEHVIRSFNQVSIKNIEKMDICEELMSLKELTSFKCTFNYICNLNQNNRENLTAIDYTFVKLLESLPPSITKLSVSGISKIDEKLAEKISTSLPNLIYLNISKIQWLDKNFLMKMPNIRYIVTHACQPVTIPEKMSVFASVCCLNYKPFDCVKFFKTYWKHCQCKKYHKVWKKIIKKSKKYRKIIRCSTNYNINLFYNEIKDGWNVLKVFDEEYFDNAYKDTYYRLKIT